MNNNNTYLGWIANQRSALFSTHHPLSSEWVTEGPDASACLRVGRTNDADEYPIGRSVLWDYDDLTCSRPRLRMRT